MKRFFTLFSLFLILFFVACSNQTTGTPVDAENGEDTDIAPDSSTNEDADIIDENDTIDQDNEVSDEDSERPEGYTIAFTIGDISLMGSGVTLATGYVMAVAREDLIKQEEEKPDGTCTFFEAPPKPVKECETDEDCAPEQRCLPRTDSRNNPIPDSDRCVTPDRESLDVGPVTISGFTSGTEQFLFEPNDKVYKQNGQGDGKVDPSLIAYDADYTVTGPDKPTVDGLGIFTATAHMPAKLSLLEPAVQSGGMMPSIPVDPKGDLHLKWSSAGGDLPVTINITGESGYISCHVMDSGDLTVSRELISQVTFATGMMAMKNTLEMIRHIKVPFQGTGVKAGTLDMEQRIVISMNPGE